jgi:hypothetical protein
MTESKNIHIQTIIHEAWNSDEGAFNYSFVFAFRDKEQYLAFRQFWKENYARLSETIRSHKHEIKTSMRKREYAGKLQGKVHELKRAATIQLHMFRAAKQEASRQYLSARQMTQ